MPSSLTGIHLACGSISILILQNLAPLKQLLPYFFPQVNLAFGYREGRSKQDIQLNRSSSYTADPQGAHGNCEYAAYFRYDIGITKYDGVTAHILNSA
jgi:hypothetical protein